MDKTAQLVRQTWGTYDEKWSAYRRRSAAQGQPVTLSCGAGCSACCSEPVYAFSHEVKVVVAAIPQAERTGVEERLREWLNRVEPSGLLAEEQPSVHVWRKLRAPCPLLKDRLCLVYASRPGGCRMHHAHGPQSACEDDEARRKQIFAHSPELDNEATRNMLQAGAGQVVLAGNFGVLLAAELLGHDCIDAAVTEINPTELEANP